jgi:LuxR family maltose regulon positive regulatory protein
VPPSPARPGLIDRHDLVAAVDHAAEKKMTIISAPAGSGKTSLLRAWAGRLGQGRRIAFMSVRPGQHDAHRTRNHRNPVTASHRPSGEP